MQVKKDPATNELIKFKSRICSDGNRMARILKSKGLEDTAPSVVVAPRCDNRLALVATSVLRIPPHAVTAGSNRREGLGELERGCEERV